MTQLTSGLLITKSFLSHLSQLTSSPGLCWIGHDLKQRLPQMQELEQLLPSHLSNHFCYNLLPNGPFAFTSLLSTPSFTSFLCSLDSTTYQFGGTSWYPKFPSLCLFITAIWQQCLCSLFWAHISLTECCWWKRDSRIYCYLSKSVFPKLKGPQPCLATQSYFAPRLTFQMTISAVGPKPSEPFPLLWWRLRWSRSLLAKMVLWEKQLQVNPWPSVLHQECP